MVAALKAHAAWLVNALGVNRNPLRRPIDRLAAGFTVLLLMIALIAIPASGLFGASLHADLTQRAAESAATTQPVTATLTTRPTLSVPVSEAYSQDALSSTAVVEWRTGLQPHSTTLQVPADSSPGDTLTVWIDQAGNRVPPPASAGSITISAIFAAILVLLVIELACIALIAGTQNFARRMSMRAWEREWAFLQHGGTWSQR
ncbi:Rv1733c family protein [Saccharopolyspora hattusasensis]|uniref:Rv1733c family protein n=1 Tax=Saccharopolyspora hattusasensis TaxID=1128679 RepID=UPI003D97860B